MESKPVSVRNLRLLARDTLKTLYEERELDSIIQILLEHYLGFSRKEVITMADTLVDESIAKKIKYAIQKLQYSIPVQYIIGSTNFYDLDFYIDRNVLIPRKETEELVHWIIQDNRNSRNEKQRIKIIDIGTGSGCIAVALKRNLEYADLTAVDVSEKVLKVAKRNADIHNTSIKFIHHNILSKDLQESFEKYDIIVSNPPYIEKKDKLFISKNVLNFEPHRALFVPDHDPLLFYKSIVDFSLTKLNKNGKIYFEINEKFGNALSIFFKEKGLKNIKLKKDLHNKDRMISAEI